MSSRRPPSSPPDIQGYEFLRVIGSGGFADVFLYQELRPRRQVAIKVLLPQWSDGTTREAFAAEADLMAAVSSHPSIVTIFDSDVTDDGRLYLAMEFCSRPNLSTRYKHERLGIAETLRVGAQIAGAVETAHRSGIVHRDIKPANILVTDYGHPALTDFGISATIEQSEAGADGMSVPWSPPETLTATPRSGVTGDVWSLAATIYTLLAGRSPFEVPGGANSQRALIERITHDPLPPIGRGDVPASLERVLAVAMAKAPEMRYPTVLELARALQQVQTELSFATSPIDILEAPVAVGSPRPAALRDASDPDGVDDGTRVRLATDRFHPAYGVVHSETPVHAHPADALSPSASQASHDSTSQGYGSVDGVPYVVVDPRPTGFVSFLRRPLVLVVVLAALVGIGGGSAVYVMVESIGGSVPSNEVPSPAGLSVTTDGSVAVFAWSNPDPQDGDFSAYRPVLGAGGADSATDPSTLGPLKATSALSVSVSTFGVDAACLEVSIVRSGRLSASPAVRCLE